MLASKLDGISLSTKLVYPEQIDIMVTAGCNAKCAFCVQEATYKPKNTQDDQFILALQNHFGDFYRSGGRKVVITGGEPLLNVPRVLSTLKELNSYPDLKLKALYTNASLLLHPWGKTTVAEALKSANLGCVNISVHHYDDSINNEILGLPNKVATQEIVAHLRDLDLPFRFNLVVQKGGIDNTDKFMRYVEWALDLGVQDIYARELFKFSFQDLMSKTDRDPINYSHNHHVPTKPIIENLLASYRHTFRSLGVKHEELRDKSEYEFIHLSTNKHIYLSQLVVGTEAENKTPYLVLMPDGQLYKGWLGKKDLI
jgi:molybdenum cofactor biosynthesis enzyme MoaA